MGWPYPKKKVFTKRSYRGEDLNGRGRSADKGTATGCPVVPISVNIHRREREIIK